MVEITFNIERCKGCELCVISCPIDNIKMSEMLMLSVNTSMTVGVVKKIDKSEIELSLKIPIVPFKGNNVGIARNINSHWRLIGYGEIV